MLKEMVSIKIDEKQVSLIKDSFNSFSLPNTGEYVIFYAKKEGTDLTIYESKKGYTLFLNGPKALNIAKEYDPNAALIKPREKEKEHYLSFLDQIGSDEVGVGDLCLPLIVCAAYVKREDIDDVLALGVHDSKKLNDDDILEIGMFLAHKVDFSKLTLPVDTYNDLINNGENLNSIKAKMHNRALYNLVNKHKNVKEIYVDQFVEEKTYYKYLKEEKDVVNNIVFKTKGESSYICVAVASILARYSFLREKQKLEEKYGMEFPFGAGKKADEFILNFIDRYGKEELKKVGKIHFANLKGII